MGKENGWFIVEMDTPQPDLRILHRTDGETEVYFFFNASLHKKVDTTVRLKNTGEVVAYDAWDNKCYSVAGGKLILEPGQAMVWCVTHEKLPITATPTQWCDLVVKDITVTLRQQETVVLQETYTQLPERNYAKAYPTFSGVIHYDFVYNAETAKQLKLERVGETARLWVNGIDCGCAVRAPYVFSVENAWKVGENQICIEVAVNQAYGRRDRFSTYAVLPPMGLFGEIEIST